MRKFLIKLVNARYSVPTWLWAIASVALGLAIVYYAQTNPALIREFAEPLPFDGLIWGAGIALAGTGSMLGMAFKTNWLVRYGSFISFCLWIFGTISFYTTGGVANVLIFGGPMLVFWAYKYIASYVRDYPRL